MLRVTFNDPSDGIRVVDCEKVSFQGREETVALLEQVHEKNSIYNLQVFPSWIKKIEYIYGYGMDKAKEVEEVREEEKEESPQKKKKPRPKPWKDDDSAPIPPLYRGDSLKPPLGLKPRLFVTEERLEEVRQAIYRRVCDEGSYWDVPDEWLEEYRDLMNTLQNKLGRKL